MIRLEIPAQLMLEVESRSPGVVAPAAIPALGLLPVKPGERPDLGLHGNARPRRPRSGPEVRTGCSSCRPRWEPRSTSSSRGARAGRA